MFKCHSHKVLVSLGIFGLVTVASAGIGIGGLRLPITIPFLSFIKPPHHHPPPPHHHQPRHHPQNHRPNQHFHDHGHASSHHVLNHAHIDQQGRYYLHDPDSAVKFFYKEHLNGPSNRVDVHHDGCREVPMDYWYNRPKSLWAKHCITLYQNGQCKGEGVQVAGMVSELRSIGMHYGVNSFKPCEKNIRIRFMPSGTYHQSHGHGYHHHHENHIHVQPEQEGIQEIQLR